MKKILSFLVLLIIVIESSAQQDTNTAVVETNAGLVSGTINKEGDVHIFKGIPFAAPPVDNLRWKAPEGMGNLWILYTLNVFAFVATL
jgi:para-nitrobenzyl esterase